MLPKPLEPWGGARCKEPQSGTPLSQPRAPCSSCPELRREGDIQEGPLGLGGGTSAAGEGGHPAGCSSQEGQGVRGLMDTHSLGDLHVARCLSGAR